MLTQCEDSIWSFGQIASSNSILYQLFLLFIFGLTTSFRLGFNHNLQGPTYLELLLYLIHCSDLLRMIILLFGYLKI